MFYLDLFAALDRHDVRYLLIGGLALNIHGVERATMDVDLTIALDDANVARFIDAAASLGMTPVVPVPLAELGDAAKRKEWIEQRNMLAFALRAPDARTPTVDVLIAPGLDFAAAYARRESKQLGEIVLSLASIDDLIAMKRDTGRERDLSDIAALEQLRRLRQS